MLGSFCIRLLISGSIARIWWCSLSSCIEWLQHILPMSPHCLSFHAFFSLVGSRWKKWRGAQAVTWGGSALNLRSTLASTDAPRLPGWGFRDANLRWIKMLEDIDQNRIKWGGCCILSLWTTCPLETKLNSEEKSKCARWKRGCAVLLCWCSLFQNFLYLFRVHFYLFVSLLPCLS